MCLVAVRVRLSVVGVGGVVAVVVLVVVAVGRFVGVVGLFDVLGWFAAACFGSLTLALTFIHVVRLVLSVILCFVDIIVIFEVDLGFTFLLFFGHNWHFGFLFIDNIFIYIFQKFENF